MNNLVQMLGVWQSGQGRESRHATRNVLTFMPINRVRKDTDQKYYNLGCSASSYWEVFTVVMI